jgi:hypothetical protein
MTELPACCYANPSDEEGKQLYAIYNAAGERRGLNYQGLPYSTWEDLTEDIQTKWRAVAAFETKWRAVPTVAKAGKE